VSHVANETPDQLFFTAMSVMAHIVSQSGDNANMTDDYRKNISAVEAATRIRGSKAFIVGWFTYTGMLWTLKICMLVFLRRVTSGLPSAKLIMPVFYAVIVSWLANILLFVTACRPFHQYWQIYPDPGSKCRCAILALLKLTLGRTLHSRESGLLHHSARGQLDHRSEHSHNPDTGKIYSQCVNFWF
jgi:hypothetical protein